MYGVKKCDHCVDGDGGFAAASALVTVDTDANA